MVVQEDSLGINEASSAIRQASGELVVFLRITRKPLAKKEVNGLMAIIQRSIQIVGHLLHSHRNQKWPSHQKSTKLVPLLIKRISWKLAGICLVKGLICVGNREQRQPKRYLEARKVRLQLFRPTWSPLPGTWRDWQTSGRPYLPRERDVTKKSHPHHFPQCLKPLFLAVIHNVVLCSFRSARCAKWH